MIIDTITIIDALKSYTPHKKHRQDPEVALWFESKSSHGQGGRKQPRTRARYLQPFHVCVSPNAYRHFGHVNLDIRHLLLSELPPLVHVTAISKSSEKLGYDVEYMYLNFETGRSNEQKNFVYR